MDNEHESIEEHLIEYAWGIIANVNGSDWSQQSNDWQSAATRWREQYHQWLDSRYRSEDVDNEAS